MEFQRILWNCVIRNYVIRKIHRLYHASVLAFVYAQKQVLIYFAFRVRRFWIRTQKNHKLTAFSSMLVKLGTNLWYG